MYYLLPFICTSCSAKVIKITTKCTVVGKNCLNITEAPSDLVLIANYNFTQFSFQSRGTCSHVKHSTKGLRR